MAVKHYQQLRLACSTLWCAALSLLLASCSLHSDNATPAAIKEAGAVQIAQAAVASSQSLQTMAEVEQAAMTPKAPIANPDPKSYGMGQVVSIDWSGPIEPLLKQIAQMTGYQLDVVGKHPAIPVLVDVYARNQPVGSILRNAAYQADSRADVIVHPRQKLIELRYANV